MKKILFFLLVLCMFKISAQNKQVLYDFAELPQTLLLNPGAETNYKFHVGVPLLSGISANFGSKNAVLTDAFSKDGLSINDKISTILNRVSTKDFFKINTQIEVLSGGLRLDEKNYISFGFYEEIDAISYYPKDGFILFNEGNDAYLNKTFSASQLMYKLDFLGVLHAGITRKVNEKLTIGGRFKIYSSALNIESTNNTGTFTTIEGSNNLYTHYFNNVNINLRSSGLYDYVEASPVEDSGYEVIDENPNSYIKNTFLGGNLGVGFDVGVTYHFDQQLEFSASIIDLGFIKHKKNIRNTTAEGNFVYEGVGFTYNSSSPVNYWGQIQNNFKRQLPIEENESSYISWRPTKLNAALKYSFGEKRSRYCFDDRYKDFYTDALGIQLYSVFRPLSPQLALTAFYQKSLTDKIHTKFTYTIDDFSYVNIGAGISAQLGKVNIYGMVDNILEYSNLSSSNSLSLQLGINLIFN